MKNNIKFIITGGTIDSHWDGKQDTAVVNEQTEIPSYLNTMVLYADVIVETICLKDSRQLNGQDLDKIITSCENSDYNRIIITHGTYTMQDTARFLQANLKRKDLVIIITGSMIPLVGFYPTDATFNLGYAMSKAENLEPGVYICMNGATFTPEEVAKNIAEGKFYSVFKKEQ